MNLRLALVGYRDFCDSTRFGFEVLDFVTSADEFESFLSCLDASGGGDTPEDLAGAIQKAHSAGAIHPKWCSLLLIFLAMAQNFILDLMMIIPKDLLGRHHF